MFEVFESIKILSSASKKEDKLISLGNASALQFDQKKAKKKERLSMFNTRQLNGTTAITTALNWHQKICNIN